MSDTEDMDDIEDLIAQDEAMQEGAFADLEDEAMHAGASRDAEPPLVNNGAAAAAAAAPAADAPENGAAAAAAPAADAPESADSVKEAEAAHRTSMEQHEAAKKRVTAASDALKAAEKARNDARQAKTAAGVRADPHLKTQVWKNAIEQAKKAETALKDAKEAAKKAKEAQKAAWSNFDKARRDEKARSSTARTNAARNFHSARRTLISAPRQAIEGLEPWDGCGGMTNVHLASAQLPPLDGHMETVVNGTSMPFKPPLNGATVLVAGTGGMKTVRTLEFLQQPVDPQLESLVEWTKPTRRLSDGSLGHINADLPLVFITPRINLAHKLDSDLEARVVHDVHNYKLKPKAMSMEDWLEHPRVIVSIEQVHKIEAWVAKYQHCIVVLDEVVTTATSIVNGVTVHRPESTLRTLRKLTDGSSYFFMMDADFDADGKGKKLLKYLAPDKPVLYVQTTVSSLPTTVLYGYERIPADKLAFEERLELSCRISSVERRDGTSPDGNRTYIAEDWPSDVNNRIKTQREWGVDAKGLHGKLGSKVRFEALKDLDSHTKDTDVFVVTSVAGIGTDQMNKYRAGFFDLRDGDHAAGPRAAAQKIGRLNRNKDKPLDPFTAPNGTHFAGGVVFVLLPGSPPDLLPADGPNGDPQKRAERKLRGIRPHVNAHRLAVLETQAEGERLYNRHNSTHIRGADGVYAALGSSERCDADPALRETLAELKALDLVEEDDKQPHSYTVKFFEMMALPSRSFKLEPIMPLGDVERAQLDDLRRGRDAGSDDRRALTDDEMVGEMTPNDQYFFIKERVEADGDAAPDSPFWQDCYGMCEAGKARSEGDNIEEAYMTVWTTLRHVKCFPGNESEDESPTSRAYMDLYNDRSQNAILYRGMMCNLSEEQLMIDEVRDCKLDVVSDATLGVTRPAYALPRLEDLARVLNLHVDDLLNSRSFTPSEHEWLAAHNRVVAGEATQGDEAMARNARAIAIKLGCKGIRHGEYVKKPTTLLATVHAVLSQQCAMRPPELKKNAARSVMHKFCVEEMAPTYAELGLHWHDGLHRKVPLGEYAELDARWKTAEAEEETQQRQAAALDNTNSMLQAEFDDCDLEMELEPASAPFDPNTLYMLYNAGALEECLSAWGVDERQRQAAALELSNLISARVAAPGTSDDSELEKMRGWRKALNRLATRHRTVVELKFSLPPAASDGPLKGALVAKEQYVYMVDGEARRYAKADGWKDDDGKWRSATAQGMPSDLRTKLLGWKFADKDGRKSDPTIYVIVAFKLGLLRSSVNVLIDEYLITDEACDAWHNGVAAHHGIGPKVVARWPNILGNGGSYKTCLEQAGLPLDSPRDARVERMEKQLKQLRPLIMKASRERPNALWPGSHLFCDRNDERLQREKPHLKPHERFNKVYSYLIETAEDKILTVHAQAQRSARRDAIGHAQFDAMPPEIRDTGGYCFDGLMTERTSGDAKAGDRAAEAALVDAGWHAQAWGIEYKIVEKPMFGEQSVHPNDFESAKGARRAMQEAADAYPQVRQAIASGVARRCDPSSAMGGNASVIPVHNGQALLTLEERGGKRRYGLFGGKAEAGETLGTTAAREANEESGRALSDAALADISALEPSAFKQCPAASMHVAVVCVGGEDLDAPSKFTETLANRPGSQTKHVGTEWVDIKRLLNFTWRKREMHWHASLMAVAVRDSLEGHAAATVPVCGEKRPRETLSDIDDDAMIAAVEAAEAEVAARDQPTVGPAPAPEEADDYAESEALEDYDYAESEPDAPGDERRDLGDAGREEPPQGGGGESDDDESDSESGSGYSGCETRSEEEAADSDDGEFIEDE